ncbi:hypothetical protein VTI74DRAFT_1865 [Chaetomium olivicolor]
MRALARRPQNHLIQLFLMTRDEAELFEPSDYEEKSTDEESSDEESTNNQSTNEDSTDEESINEAPKEYYTPIYKGHSFLQYRDPGY